MLSLLDAERMKLFTTRSPWWCMAATVATAGAVAALVGSEVGTGHASVTQVESGWGLALLIVLAMAGLSVTTEYHFGTIRSTFQAVPHRTAALLAKTAVVALTAAVLGESSAFAAVGLAALTRPQDDLALRTAQQWRNVVGVGVVFLVSAVLAVALLIRRTVGTMAVLLVYPLLGERLVKALPGFGDSQYHWLPFNLANHFLTGGVVGVKAGDPGVALSETTLTPWWALVCSVGVAVAFLAVALVVAEHRDA